MFTEEKVEEKLSKLPFVNYVKQRFNLGQYNQEEQRRAIVQKSGHYRVKYTGLKEYRAKFFQDLYITLIDLKWRYALAVLFNVHLLSYFFFALMWYWMMYNHGDLDHLNDPKWESCVAGVHSFGDAMLFSIESQTTIGYGFAYPNTDCGGALPLLFVQITVGILLENVLLGFIFVKFAQPKRRRKTIMFSKVACVAQEEGDLCLQIRVGDMRQSHLIDAKVHGILIKRHVTREGVAYPLFQHDVHFQANKMGDTIMLMWPLILSHRITQESPFWDIRPSDLSSEAYELVVCIEGTLETTGEFCQARTSYLPSEILWGHRFDRIEEFDAGNGRWEIDFSGFNDVVYITNIRHSAKELNPYREYRMSKEESEATTKEKGLSISLHSVAYDLPPEFPSASNSTEYQKSGSPKLLTRGLSQMDELERSRLSLEMEAENREEELTEKTPMEKSEEQAQRPADDAEEEEEETPLEHDLGDRKPLEHDLGDGKPPIKEKAESDVSDDDTIGQDEAEEEENFHDVASS
ncbi:G protein-activated inward rectifier potassium channel 2-like [Crassostrea angulata]|uniref:G protein-activated inward rectifier potassium channel 2-like n=1 Tax=Magallana angulata TaxID=2784310 RepID=UPI0022B1D934|nr:G protein-activated inward rectifier potassium channel 2-like [Crassostrea angulata]